ncbi:MAG: IS1182 family transposase [Cyanobacteria bacterium P01_E01_bin.43]
MSIKPQPIAEIPALTQQVAKAAFPKGNPYLTLRDELGTVFKDADFTELFSTTGKPGLPPWRLALITLLQFRENLSDRQAADSVRSRIDWKYLLGLELTDEGFDFSVLSEFRDRLIDSEQEHLLLDKLLDCAQEKGLLKPRGKQRTDATRVLASVRKLNRLELVGETMRAALNELATVAPEWLSDIVPNSNWYERYGRRVEDYQLPKSEAKRNAWAQAVGEDAYYLLFCLEASRIVDWETLPKIQALKLMLERHYEYDADGELNAQVRWKPKKELPRAETGIESPYDIDARFRSRRGVNWVGYAVHLSETCDDEQCHLITHVETTDATVHEAQRTEAIHQSLIDKKLPPSEHFVDSAYVSAEHLVNAKEQQIEMVGPTRQNASWQSKTEGAYDEAQFDINWSQETVTCPQGKHSKSWKTRTQESGRTYVQVRFSKRDCDTCGVKELCTRGVQRSLAFLPQTEYEALEQAREDHRSEAGQERYKRRAGIEGTISQGVRGFGLRRSRYRGLPKTHLQNVAIGAAINIDRLINWINGVPLERTRVSRFKALEVA